MPFFKSFLPELEKLYAKMAFFQENECHFGILMKMFAPFKSLFAYSCYKKVTIKEITIEEKNEKIGE